MVSIGDAGEEKDKSRGCVIFPLLATSSTQRRRSQASTKKKKKRPTKANTWVTGYVSRSGLRRCSLEFATPVPYSLPYSLVLCILFIFLSGPRSLL